jgi:hypothetical protein
MNSAAQQSRNPRGAKTVVAIKNGRVAQTCCLLACLRIPEAADIAKCAMSASPIDSDKNRNGTVLFFNDIMAFNVFNYLIINNITALRLRNA